MLFLFCKAILNLLHFTHALVLAWVQRCQGLISTPTLAHARFNSASPLRTPQVVSRCNASVSSSSSPTYPWTICPCLNDLQKYRSAIIHNPQLNVSALIPFISQGIILALLPLKTKKLLDYKYIHAFVQRKAVMNFFFF